MKIGFFDSGLGGLIILKEVVRRLPQYDYVYYADTANLPYGDKTETDIYELTKQAIVELFARNCLLVIVACNTASAETLRKLQDTFLHDNYPDHRVLGVIVPTIEELLQTDATRAILLATKRTVESNKYAIELQKKVTNYALEQIPMSELVPLIEAGKIDEALERTIATLQNRQVGKGDVVVFGCTHYTLLKDSLRAYFKEVTFLAQDEIIPEKLESYLVAHPELTARLKNGEERTIHLTEHRPDYDQLAAQFLGGFYAPEA